MGAEIRIYPIGSSWTLLPGGHGFYINNGNVNIYIQQQSGDAPESTDTGVRIRPGGKFMVSHDLHKITYLRTDGGTTTIAKYDDPNNGTGTVSLVDPTSGNHAIVADEGCLSVAQSFMRDTDGTYKPVSVQNPLPTDGDSVYEKDIWIEESISTDWLDVDEAGLDAVVIPFTNLHTRIANTTATNPKILHIHFNRTISMNQVGIGCFESGNFSNVLIKLIGSGNVVRGVVDESANDTKFTSRNYKFGSELCNAVQIEFHTADPVCISNITIQKIRLNAIVQNIADDNNNSSIANLDADNGYTFTGSKTVIPSVGAIQWMLKTDQNATVYVDQSTDGTNWDVTTSYEYFYSKGGDSQCVKAVGLYYRIRVVGRYSVATTFFRLQSKMIPIAEALPTSLDTNGNLKTSAAIFDAETLDMAEVEPLGNLKTVSPVRLVGTAFNNGTKDPNFWTETVVGSGIVTQEGQIILTTGETANSSAKYATIAKGRKVPGATNQFRASGRLVTDPAANNVRRIGCYDVNNGYFFQVNGIVFGIGSRKATVDTIVANGSFNGNLGATVPMDTLLKRLTINYTSTGADFFINNRLLHSVSSDTDAITNSSDFPVTMENYNKNGNTVDHSFQIRFASIVRLGELTTSPIYRAISTNATHVLKYGSGVLQRIIVTDNAGTLTVYDNTSAAGALIATIDAAKTVGSLDFGVPFSNGLTIVSATNAKCTVVYE